MKQLLTSYKYYHLTGLSADLYYITHATFQKIHHESAWFHLMSFKSHTKVSLLIPADDILKCELFSIVLNTHINTHILYIQVEERERDTDCMCICLSGHYLLGIILVGVCTQTHTIYLSCAWP